jgi:hypothetical protein
MSPRDPHKDAGVPETRPGEGTFPKPSRDDATAAGSMEEMTPGAAQSDQSDRYATGRRDPEASLPGEEHPPHVTANDADAPVQDSNESEEEVPVLPANASGEDQVSTEDQPDQIDDESAYDRRPEEDKDWSSGDGAGSDGR